MARVNKVAVVERGSTGHELQYGCSRAWLTVFRKARQHVSRSVRAGPRHVQERARHGVRHRPAQRAQPDAGVQVDGQGQRVEMVGEEPRDECGGDRYDGAAGERQPREPAVDDLGAHHRAGGVQLGAVAVEREQDRDHQPLGMLLEQQRPATGALAVPRATPTAASVRVSPEPNSSSDPSQPTVAGAPRRATKRSPHAPTPPTTPSGPGSGIEVA